MKLNPKKKYQSYYEKVAFILKVAKNYHHKTEQIELKNSLMSLIFLLSKEFPINNVWRKNSNHITA